jgi:hypothetical protein
MLVKLKHVRLSFAKIWHPEAMKNPDGSLGKTTYSANFLITHDDPQAATVDAVIEQQAQEKWGDKWQLILERARALDLVCLHNGDMKADYDGYAGHFYLTARSDTKPLIIGRVPWIVDPETGKPITDARGKPIANELKEEGGLPYGGCYVNANVDVYCYSKPKAGNTATLKGIQFVEDGEAFAGGPPARPEDFDNEDAPGERPLEGLM